MTAVVTDDMVERGAEALTGIAHMGCTCYWDKDGNPPDDCWCAERWDRERRALAAAVITAALSPPEDRACLCGCPHERTGKGQFYEDACRVRYWKDRTGYVDPRTVKGTNGTNGAETVDSRPRRPGGLQVAFGPAQAAVAAEFEKHGLTYPKARATMVLRRALSGKQRARLDARAGERGAFLV